MAIRTAGRTIRVWLLACLLVPSAPAAVFAFEDADVRAIVGNTRAVEANPGARGLWMARQRRVEIDGVGNTTIAEHLLARVIDPAWGREKFAPYRRIFWDEFTGVTARARIWHSRSEFADLPTDSIRFVYAPEGGGVASYRRLRECRISFPPLQEGEVAEIILNWNCPIPEYDRNVRWLEETFAAEDPVIEQQLALRTPTAMVIDTASVGPGLRAHFNYVAGLREVTWITGNLQPVRAHFVETPWSRVVAPDDTVGAGVTRIMISTLGTWTFAAQYFGAQWEDSWSRRSADVDRFVRDVLGKEKDPTRRALALQEAVRTECRTLPVPDLLMGMWPQPAALVALERAGGPRDKSLLLVTLLRAAGIPASPVLVRERRDRWVESIPTIAQFDRWVVRAQPAESAPLWLDPVGSPRAIPPGRGLLFTGASDPSDLQAEAGLVEFPGIAGSSAGATGSGAKEER